MVLVLTLGACASETPPAPVYIPPTLEPLQVSTLSPTPLLPATPIPSPTPTATPTPAPEPVCLDTRGRVETGSYFSHILGREMSYRIYLPPCYGADDRTYPVLYLLHGYPFNETHWDQLGADETANTGIRSQAYPYFIIVMPNCDPSPEGIFVNTSGGDQSVEGLVVNELLPHIDQTYQTQAEREGRAIGGISRGGVWSLEIGFRRADLFATVGAHSAALSVNYPHPLYDPLKLATDPQVATLRIWLDAGDVDWANVGVKALHQVLEDQNVPHEYQIGEGEHDDEYWSRMLPAYLAFYTASWMENE